MSQTQFCKFCVYPVNQDLIDPASGLPMEFDTQNDEPVCAHCLDLLKQTTVENLSLCSQNEMMDYLRCNKRVLYAYSGGLDSTAVLFHLQRACRAVGSELTLFTIETGVKGRVAKANIQNIVSHMDLTRNHFFLDIRNQVQTHPKIIEVVGTPKTTLEVYGYCDDQHLLPCGKTCNTMIDQAYGKFMAEQGFTELITGGDTPKKNPQNNFSIFWEKPSGLIIVRGAFGFGLSKSKNIQLIKKENLPWKNPDCGGYDTDCLIPGAYFYDEWCSKNGLVTIEDIVTSYPIILHYLAERVRFGVLNRERALAQITKLDVSSPASYQELHEIKARTKKE
ncbi:MAG: hypothetical protein P1P90_00395 [Patescibacteria group bacterium]|nr:hypothetical protein [Patescibacteria group bacterium]